MLDYIRIACAVPPVQVADISTNTADICHMISQADAQKCDIVLFPELALTGYSCADLFFQDHLLNAAVCGLDSIITHTKNHPCITAIVGVPLVLMGQMYNCGAVIRDGVLWGIVPKTYLPNYQEFYERRWFSSSKDLHIKQVNADQLGLQGSYPIPIGSDLIFQIGDGALLSAEICEDLWTPMPPSTLLTLNGAEIIVNLSASNETVGKRDFRRSLVKHQSSICNCIYAYASSGYTESTQDLVFSGNSLIAENGNLLGENEQPLQTDYLLIKDADLGKIRCERRKNKSVRDATSFYGKTEPVRVIACNAPALRSDGSLIALNKLPFLPTSYDAQMERCNSIFNLQVTGLAQRLKTVGAKAVIGISGGLDSTLALLVAAEATRRLGRPTTDLHGITMPCFGTSDRTLQNARALMDILGITSKEIPISEAVNAHFADIGHDCNIHDATYENAQARERTQVLMDYASQIGGLVVGTGDLSELALGWCTYNGDHMSMYGVNSSVPKTMIPLIIKAIAQTSQFAAVKAILMDIIDTPISPELLPPDPLGNISQCTEDVIGPYILHDFFLYHMLRFDYTPRKIYTLACRTFENDFGNETIKKWLRVFYRRFFTQQFKRSCMPDGVKVGNISLSPRGDWRMPSDISGKIWLTEIENL